LQHFRVLITGQTLKKFWYWTHSYRT